MSDYKPQRPPLPGSGPTRDQARSNFWPIRKPLVPGQGSTSRPGQTQKS